MSKKYRLTRPELKRQRDALQRFERYLPMLKLKQQQLQVTLRDIEVKRERTLAEAQAAKEKFQPTAVLLADPAGVNVRQAAQPAELKTSQANVAGVTIPVLREVVFPQATYSLFSTPAWVDRAIAELRALNRLQAQADVLQEQYVLLHRELMKIVQRVNLFEKVKIPEAREAIRVIRIRLGDEMAAAVGRAKMAKAKIVDEAPLERAAGPQEAAS